MVPPKTQLSLLIALLTALFINSVSFAANETSALNNIDSLERKNRIILVYCPSQCPEIVRLLEDEYKEIVERDIVWFTFFDQAKENKFQTNYSGLVEHSFSHTIRNKYFKQGQASVVLIGKDSGIKDRRVSLDLKYLYKKIDAMPMRQFEIRRQGQ